MEWSELEFQIQCLPLRSHRCIDRVLRRFTFCLLANRARLFANSNPDRLLPNVCRRALSLRCSFCLNPGRDLRVSCRAASSESNRNLKSEIGNRKLNGGGGGIRTHEG